MRKRLPKKETRLTALALVLIAATCLDAEQAKSISVYVAEPVSSKMILPDTFPIPGKISDQLSVTATPGEYEPASLVLRPSRDIKGLRIEPSDLKTSNAVIPAKNVDVKIVKCWYQATSAWTGIHTRPKERRNVLVPELMLNDDTLVKVDRKEKKNYVKLSLPNGPEYIWINDPNEPGGDKMKILAVEEYPIRDSHSLMPLNIPADTNKQIWITVRVPDDAQSGTYTGSIRILSDTRTLASVTLNLRVLPFKLAEPKTHYDLAQPFASSIYYRAKLHRDYPKGTISSEYKSEQQLRAELANMFVHGITNPTCYQGFNPELLGRHLQIRNEIGMAGMPLYYLGVSANSNPATIKNLKDFVKAYSINEVYFYGVDEAKGERLKAQRKAWQATKEAGGKVFVAGGISRNFEAMGDIQDLHICAGAPKKAEAEKWHSVGHKVFSYANPQGGPEDPQLWRRNFGLALWMQDYDGACTYCYQHSFGNIWNDSDHYHYRDHILAYPTTDGVIDTIALEGYREAIDDIRYATTLMLEIQKARNSARPEKIKLADSAEKWLADLKSTTADLNETRSKIIDYILKLIDA